MAGTAKIDYEVLARKYRPGMFSELIGQDAMVRTLRNAFQADRVAHAFIMTGVRGVGKTTAARIIAKGLNCIGADGKGDPTTEPCGSCEHCRSIAEGRHIDVIEMDAASNTSVNDVREIIDSVQYKSASARYKVYIVDEVHMLSNSAFNALLKTLEEPPSHVKFIFATTEIRKVPVTVLSRCQRFDLHRVNPSDLISHLKKIAGLESVEISEEALALIARAAEGSVRDAVSLLDQAISLGSGKIDKRQVREMMGLADRLRILDLFDLIMKGDARGALEEFTSQYRDGADPVAVLRELAETTHWVSVVKHFPEAADDPTVGAEFRSRAQAMADALPTRATARTWQMLLASLNEVSSAPNSMMAAEMAIIRLTHVSDLPTPEELIKKLESEEPERGRSDLQKESSGASSRAYSGPETRNAQMKALPTEPVVAEGDTFDAAESGTIRVASEAKAGEGEPGSPSASGHYSELLQAIDQFGDESLKEECRICVASLDVLNDELLISLHRDSSAEFRQRLEKFLKGSKFSRYRIALPGDAKGHPSSNAPVESSNEAGKRVEDHPLVRSVLTVFPGASVLPGRSSRRAVSSGIWQIDRRRAFGA
ncbi:MAG: DNA polymerase III subunit gamma/tau [Albidovulum sp.]|nr:DNA polymerase III subunit gamma/tau [Albidovulum sp.]